MKMPSVSFLTVSRLRFSLAVLLSLALLAAPVRAAEPRWQPVGPYGHDGYRLFPTGDPEILYVTTSYSGLYRSEDGGESWREVSPLSFAAVSVDPRDPDVLYAASTFQERIVRSVDGGRTFEVDSEGFLYGGSIARVNLFVRDPADPDVVFAATDLGLFRKDEVGEWQLIAFGGRAVTAFAIDPLAPAVWHAATNKPNLLGPGELWISRNSGSTWSLTAGEVDRRDVRLMAFDPVRPHRIYALAGCRPVVFARGAWRILPLDSKQSACTMTVTGEGRLVASIFESSGTRERMALSDDGGLTWSVYSGPRDVVLRIVPTGEEGVLMASGGRGLWRSVDGGVTWRASSRGITGFVVGAIAVARDGTVFASPGGEGVFRSRDAGRSWERRVEGLHADARTSPTLAVDPRDPEVVWAGALELHRSRDGGRTWQGLALPRGVEDRTIEQIVIDPVRPGVVYVRTYAPVGPGIVGPFVYRTFDDGRTWQPLPRLYNLAGNLAVAPSDGTLYAWGFEGMYVSRDAGTTWRQTQSRRTLPFRVVSTLAVDPRRSNVLWIGTEDQGVWRSEDAGRSLELMLAGEVLLGRIGGLVFDPADPLHPYAGVASQGIYQWRRTGWRKVGADDYFHVAVDGPLAFDPVRRIFYAGTSTRGIYRLP